MDIGGLFINLKIKVRNKFSSIYWWKVKKLGLSKSAGHFWCFMEITYANHANWVTMLVVLRVASLDQYNFIHGWFEHIWKLAFILHQVNILNRVVLLVRSAKSTTHTVPIRNPCVTSASAKEMTIVSVMTMNHTMTTLVHSGKIGVRQHHHDPGVESLVLPSGPGDLGALGAY